MTACTDDERREVARRLRSLRKTNPGVTSLGHGYLWSLLWAVSGEELGESDRGDWFERMCSRIADLIEPPTQCPYYHSDRHHCSAYDDVVDREALLALADELEEGDVTYLVSTQYVLDSYARRIREALGAES